MWCPRCGHEKTLVQATVTSSIVERFRKCQKCGHTFSTAEGVAYEPSWKMSAAYSDEEINRILEKRKTKQKDIFND